MSKIASEHLERSAYIYIRQSTPDQVHRNPESRRRQYGLEARARQLGWQEVVVVDEDLGRSGAGTGRWRTSSGNRKTKTGRSWTSCTASSPMRSRL